VATHEIMHSWTGNLVTNENWSSFWLNEGFTVFNERKASEKLYGKDFKMVSALIGNFSMVTDMSTFGFDHSYSSLTPDLTSDNPDNCFSTVPYEKGFQFLYFLEGLVGEKTFESFMKDYLTKFAYYNVSTSDFK